MYKSFEEKQHPTKVNGNRHDVRKANVNSSVVGEEIKKPVHLKNKKKSLLQQKLDLLKRKNKHKGL